MNRGEILFQTSTLLLVTTLCAPLHAQDMGPPPDAPMRSDFEFTLGALALYGPAYLGSDKNKARALPVIGARWRNGAFAGVGGVGWRFQLAQGLSAGVRLGADFGRKESSADALRGMGDIDPQAELGAFASWRIAGPVSLGVNVRAGSGEERSGLLADIGLRGAVPIAAHWRLNAGVGVTYANAPAMRSYFGVNAEQSARSGYALYSPQGGWRDSSVNLGLGWQATPQSVLQFGVNHRVLMGDAKSSPITRDRSGSGLTLGWFWRYE